MITADYLEEWSMENGEDVVMDGPYIWTGKQWETLGLNIILRLEKEFSTKFDIVGYDPDCWYETTFATMEGKNLDYDKGNRLILEEMANLINKENIEEY